MTQDPGPNDQSGFDEWDPVHQGSASQVVEPEHSADGSDPGQYGRKQRKARKPRSKFSVIREYLTLAVVAVVLASLVRAFIGQAYYIPSESMVPTLLVKDKVIVSRLSYKLNDPHRGDIIVFQNPGYVDKGRKDIVSRSIRSTLELVGIGQPKDKYYIKRAIGLPGDSVQMKDDHVFINGKQLPEPWLKPGVKSTDNGSFAGAKPVKLGLHQYFMMGDNREFSADSRTFGPIQEKSMIGKAFVRIYPLSRVGGL